MRALALALLLAACERAPAVDDSPGGRLERAAVERGLVIGAAATGLTGSWASETDRLCIVPQGATLRVGATVDYGEGQACAAAGEVRREGDRLRVRFGDCRFDAAFEGERITFPAELPEPCERFCAGRASLAALAVERLSDAASEAASLRSSSGKLLCAAN